MPSCEKCWKDAGGNPDRYTKLVRERKCTPEEQAGDDAGNCNSCGRRTMHQHCHICMNPSCSSNQSPQTEREGIKCLK
jgi:hypothetical protein